MDYNFAASSGAILPRKLLLDEVTDRVADAAAQVEKMTDLARAVADSVFGSVPMPGATVAVSGVDGKPLGRGELLQHRLGLLGAHLDKLDAQLGRLNAL